MSRPPSQNSSQRLLISALGAALFILSLGAVDSLTRGALSLPTLLPPFGASTVIVFFAPDTVASRAWNVTIGHLGSALVALLVLFLLPGQALTSQAALAVSGAAVWMVATKSVHPPGGATALLAVLSQPSLGKAALLLPVLLGCVTLIAIRWVIDLLSAPWWLEGRAASETLSHSLPKGRQVPPV